MEGTVIFQSGLQQRNWLVNPFSKEAHDQNIYHSIKSGAGMICDEKPSFVTKNNFDKRQCLPQIDTEKWLQIRQFRQTFCI